MLNTRFILLLFLLFTSSSFGQKGNNYVSFRNCLNEGTYWFYEQNYDSARYYFEKAEHFELIFFPVEAQLYSRTLWELGQKEKSIEVLLKGGRSDLFKDDSTFYKGMTASERTGILSQLPKMNAEIPYGRYQLLERMERWGKVYRIRIVETKNKDSIPIYKNLITYQDHVNLSMLIKDVKENGYLGGYVYGGSVLKEVLLLGEPVMLMNNYALFLNEIDNGRMNPFDFAITYDRAISITGSSDYTPYNVYKPTDSIQTLTADLIFINRCIIGMSPYYDIQAPLIYTRGNTPPKSKLYDYYRQRKEDFNCIKIR